VEAGSQTLSDPPL